MKAPELKPMGIGDILDAAFRLYREHFGTFITIALVVYVPYAIFMAVLGVVLSAMTGLDGSELAQTSFVQPPAPAPELPSMTTALFAGVATLLGIMLFMVLVYPLCMGALVLNISAGYLGKELSAVESYVAVFKKVGRLIGAQFLATMIIMLGFVLCVVPGVIFSLWYMLVPAVVLLEDVPARDALKRSRALVQGNLGKAFLLGLVVGILSMIVSAGASFVFTLIPWPEVVATFLTNLASALPLPLSVGVVVLFYYDLRIRKEGFDLSYLAAQMGQPTMGQPTSR